MIKTKILRITAFLMAVIMIIGFTASCKGSDNEIVYTIDGVEVSSGLYLQVQLSAYGAAVEKVIAQEQKLSETEVDSVSIQYNILQYEIDGVSTEQWIASETLKMLKRYRALENEYDRLGLSLAEGASTQIEEKVVSSFDGSVSLYNFMGISRNALKTLETYNVKADQLYEAYYTDEEASEKITVDEALVYLNENFTKGLLYPILLSEIKEEEKEEFWDDMTELAMKLSEDDSNFATQLSELNEKYGLSTDEQKAKEKEEAFGKKVYSLLLTRSGSEYIPQDTVDRIWSITSFNKYVYFESGGIGQLISRFEQTKEDAEENFDDLASGMRLIEFQDKLEELSTELEVTENKGLLRKYSAKKLPKKVKKAGELFQALPHTH